jgi:hypothetical protein
MQIRVLCPGCQKKLAIPARLAGKTLRCPGCQLMFRVPASPAGPAPGAFPPAPGPAAPSGNPFDFAGPAAPPANGSAAAPATPTAATGLGWGLVRRGVGLAYVGLILDFVSVFIALIAGGSLAGSFFVPPVPAEQTNVPQLICWIGAVIFGILSGLLYMLGGTLSFIGRLLCCAVPQGVASRLCIWGSVACVLLWVLALTIGGAVSGLNSANPPGKGAVTITKNGQAVTAPGDEAMPGGADALGQALQVIVPILLGLAVVLSVVVTAKLLSDLLWVLYLRQLACLLHNPRLASGVVIFVVFQVVWPLLFACAGGVAGLIVWGTNSATPAALPWLTGVPAGLVGLVLFTAVLWYFILLRRTRTMLRRATGVA